MASSGFTVKFFVSQRSTCSLRKFGSDGKKRFREVMVVERIPNEERLKEAKIHKTWIRGT